MKKVEFESVENAIKMSGAAKFISDNLADAPLVVSGVPDEWKERFRSSGFADYAQYRDYWIDRLTPSGNNTVHKIYGGDKDKIIYFLIEADGVPIGDCWVQKMNLQDVKPCTRKRLTSAGLICPSVKRCIGIRALEHSSSV